VLQLLWLQTSHLCIAICCNRLVTKLTYTHITTTSLKTTFEKSEKVLLCDSRKNLIILHNIILAVFCRATEQNINRLLEHLLAEQNQVYCSIYSCFLLLLPFCQVVNVRYSGTIDLNLVGGKHAFLNLLLQSDR